LLLFRRGLKFIECTHPRRIGESRVNHQAGRFGRGNNFKRASKKEAGYCFGYQKKLVPTMAESSAIYVKSDVDELDD
jgi:hypothetical protein